MPTPSSVTSSTSFHHRHRHPTNEMAPRQKPGRHYFRPRFSMIDTGSPAGRELAIAIHAAAVAGVDPGSATQRAVAARLSASTGPIWIIALGKAALAMARAACAALRVHNAEPAGGILV